MENNNLATPAVWYPGQSELDYQEEINLMLYRSQMTTYFLQGEIPADTFLDFLEENGFDVFQLADDWELGR